MSNYEKNQHSTSLKKQTVRTCASHKINSKNVKKKKKSEVKSSRKRLGNWLTKLTIQASDL